MKPRIVRLHGIWHCRASQASATGLGYTPSQAFFDWLAVIGGRHG